MGAPASVRFEWLRIAALDANGAPIGGSPNEWNSAAVGRLLITPRVQQGRRLAFVRASGDVGPIFNSPDRLIGADLRLEICAPDPEALSRLTGGEMLRDDDGVPVFWAPPFEGTDALPNGVSVEAWSRAVDGSPAADYAGYSAYHWALPMTHWVPAADDINIGPLDVALVGYAERNANWGSGPDGDWTGPSDQPYQRTLASGWPCDDGYRDDYVDMYGCVV